MPRSLLTAFAALLALGLHLSAYGQEKVTYADHARAVMENKCFSCHNPDKKKGDLDLTSYAAVMAGGGGGAVVTPGDPDGSKLIGTITKKEEPFMPPEGAPMSPAEIEVLKKWIAGGVLDTANSVAKKSDKPKVDLNVAAGTGKPEGPIAKPEHVLLEPVVVTPRTTAVVAMAASPWGPLVAMASPKQILLYDTDTRQLAGVLPYPEGYARSLKFSRSGSLLIMGRGRPGKIGHAVIWDVKTGKRVAEVGKEFDSLMSADISPDHKKVVIGSPSKKVKCYDLATGEELYTIAKHTEWILATQFSPDGILLGTADRNGNVFVWEADNGGEFYLLGQHKGGACTDIAWRSDSNVLASCSRDGTVIVWEMNEGKQLKSWTAHGGGVESISFTPDGRILTCGLNGAVTMWDINGNKQADLPNQGDVAAKIVALHDSKTCVVSNWRGDVKMYDLATKAEIGSLSSNPQKIDQRIEMAQKRLEELTAKTAPSQQAIQAADAEAKKRGEALAKAKADLEAIEARKKALPVEIKTAEQALAEAKAARDKAAKDKETLAAQHKAYNARLAALQATEKESAAASAEAEKAAAAQQALASANNALDAARKELAAKADDSALQTKVKDQEAKVAAATADVQAGSLDQIKQRVDVLAAKLSEQKAQLGQPLPPLETAEKGVAEAEAKLKASSDLLAAKKNELPKVEEAAKKLPAVIKDLEGKVAEGQKALALAQSTAKAIADELVIQQRAIPSLKAAKFNVGVLTEREALAKLESDVQAYTDGAKENEEAKAAAQKRIEDSKKAIADATAALPTWEAEASKQLAELQPVEKVFNDSKSVQDQVAAKVNEQKQIIAAKEAEIAGLAKVRDDGTAAIKTAVEAINKELAKHQKSLEEAAQKLAAPAKAVEDRKVLAAKAEAELSQGRKDADGAKAAAAKAAIELASKDSALAKARSESEAAAKDSQAKQQAAAKVQPLIGAGVKMVQELEKALGAAKAANGNDAAKTAESEKALAEAKATLAPLEQEMAAAATAVKNAEEKKAGLAAAQQAAQEAKRVADEGNQALEKATGKVKERERALAEAKKNVEATEQKAAPFRKVHEEAEAKVAGAKKALAEKQAASESLMKEFEAKAAAPNATIAQAKAALVPLEKALADATAKAAGDQKALEAKRAEVGKAQAAVADAKKRKADAEQAIAAATKEIPERERNVAEAKAELAKLQPQVEPLRAKVKQLHEQYLAMLPK